MIRVLIAAADPLEAAALHGQFEAGFAGRAELEVVGGALYALTSLERQGADLVVSAETLEDMDGRDLFELVCDDEALRQVPFVLLSGSFADIVPLPQHALLGAHATPAAVLAAAFTLLVAAGKLAEPRRGAGDKHVTLSGTFEALPLFDLVTSLNRGRKSGRLMVEVGDDEAVLHFDEGNLNHAHLDRANGEEAVIATFSAVERRPTSTFRFVAASGESGGGLVTIQTSVDKLLLLAAVALDEQKRVAA